MSVKYDTSNSLLLVIWHINYQKEMINSFLCFKVKFLRFSYDNSRCCFCSTILNFRQLFYQRCFLLFSSTIFANLIILQYLLIEQHSSLFQLPNCQCECFSTVYFKNCFVVLFFLILVSSLLLLRLRCLRNFKFGACQWYLIYITLFCSFVLVDWQFYFQQAFLGIKAGISLFVKHTIRELCLQKEFFGYIKHQAFLIYVKIYLFN